MSVNEGHRKRLDKKVNEYGLEMLEEHEQLEHILFMVIPRGNTNQIAHRLIDRYGSIGAVLNADPEELIKIEGVGYRTAQFLAALPSLLGIVERSLKKGKAPKMESLDEIVAFARTYFYGQLTESAYIFCLNPARRLKAVSKISYIGSDGEAFMFPPKLVIKRAICDKASSVVVVHNHPCGIPKPSQSDIKMSHELKKAFDATEIKFIDSVILTDEGYFSLFCKGYLSFPKKKYE